MKDLIQRLVARTRPTKSSIEILAETDAYLITDEERELLKEVAEGRDPFERKKQEREKERQKHTPFRSSGYTLECLQKGAGRLARAPVDITRFPQQYPELHQTLLRAHKMLEKSKDWYKERDEDPPGDERTPHLPGVIVHFRKTYRLLKEAMQKLRDHYLKYESAPDKWVSLVQRRLEEFEPLYHAVMEKEKS